MKKNHSNFRLTAITVAMIQAALLTPAVVGAAAPAPMTAANGNTGVALAPNGVPVVNIAAPNAAGLSHNQYTQFNVDSRGVVFNNGDMSQITRQSQLAGQVFANPNLQSQASVILNEVVSPNRSQLNGYVEVLGGKADVVIANPYGITCNGCGFINTDRASLTTGTPIFGANGGLSGYQVNGGDVLVSGSGLDGKSQSYFDIVARTVKLDGQLNAGDLNITTGTGTWNYASRSGIASTPSDTVSGYAFDSTALGGMYANKIKIVANDAGVGVHVLGDVGATAGDFSIDSAGQIQFSSHISAQDNITANYSGTLAGGAAAIEVSGTNTSLASHGNIALTASNAGVTLTDAALTADGALTVNADSLTDSSTTGAKRFAGTDTTLNTGNADSISGTSWGAGGKLTVVAGSLTLGSNTALYSGANSAAANRDLSLTVGSGDLDLAANSVKSSGNVSLVSQQGGVKVAAGGDGVSADGNLNVTAHTSLNNAGNMLAAGDVTVGAPTLQNTGVIQSGGTETLNAAAQTNSGSLLGNQVNVNATTLDNSGTIQGGNVDAQLGTSLTNEAAGQIIGNNTLTINGGSLLNNGRLQASNGASISGTSLQNTGNQAVILTSTTGTGAGTITVSGALSNDNVIHGNGALALTAASITNTGTGGISVGDSSSDLTLKSTAGNIDNSGALYAGGKLWINTQNGAGNYDFINERSGQVGGTDLDFKVGNFTNYNEIVASHNIDVAATGNFTNTVSTTTGVPTIVTKQVYTNGMIPPANDPGSVDVLVKTFAPPFDGQADVVYTLTDTTVQQLSNSTGLQSAKMIAGNAIKLNIGGNGSNYGSLISAPSVDITTPVNSIFNNQSIDLTTTTSNKLWMSDLTGGDWDLYIPGTLDQYNLMKNATSSQLFALAESGQIPCNCSTGNGIVDYPDTIEEVVGQQTSIWADLDGSGENAWNAARASAYANVNVTTTTAASAQIKASSFAMHGGTLSNTQSPYTPDNKTPSAPSVAPGSNGQTPGGLNLNLPSNPNGFFVTDKDPNSQYLIESNPLFGPGSNLYGSNYLFSLFGYNPDTIEKRLGDSDYEAELIRDQIIAQTGSDILAGYDSSAAEMQALMDSAYAQSHDLALQVGVPLTPAQTANLKSDLVWMVEQDVDGQKVLAPVVYLAASTRSAVVTGAVIDAKNVMIDGAGLTNTGGTIAASNTLKVTTTGDIVNTGGTIKGGTVALTSTDGSIRNETFVKDAPTDGSTSGVIGKQASITASGALDADAKNDIVVTGAKLSAGGDMTLTAGRDVTATTLVNNDTSAQHGADGGLVKATIDAKNLTVDAGRDVVAKGADIHASNDASIAAKHDVTLDTVQQTSVGFTGSNSGVGYNTSVTSTTTHDTNQIGTGLNVGGNLAVKSGNDVTVAGSQVNVGGDASIDAKKNLNVIDRQNTSVATTLTDTHSLSTGYTGVSFNDTKTTSTTTTSTSVGSGINAGGNTKLKAGDTLTVKGSDVATGGNLDLNAKSISVLAGQNTVDNVTHTESTAQGYSISGDANSAGITYSNSKTTTDANSSNSTARTSTLTSGGNMTRTATDTITDQGTQITAGGDFTQKAKTINMLAAQNTQSSNTTSHTDTNSAGVTVVYSAGDAYNDAKHGSAAGAAAASGGPTVGVNYGHDTQDSNSTGNGSQAVVTTVKAGGKITSTSTEDTHLEGASLDSKGDTTITARTLTVDAAHNTTGTSNSSSETSVTARVDVDVSGKPGGEVDASHSNSNGSSDSSTAVVGKINAGGNLKINTTGDTNLEATQLSAKGNASIDAGGNVNVTAAHNTNDSSNSSLSEGGSVGASKDAGSGSVNVASSSGDNKSSTAVTGSITAGNNVSIKSGKDVTLEGADITSGKDTTINAKGKVDLLAATSTTSSDSSQVNFSLSAQGSKGQGGTKNNGNDMGAGAVSGSGSSNSTETKKVSNITTGGNLKVVSGSTTTLEGTQADVGGKATLSAKGGVVKKDAVSTTHTSSTAGGISAGVGKGVAVGGAAVTSDHNDTQTATSVSIKQHDAALKKAKAAKKVADAKKAAQAKAKHVKTGADAAKTGNK